MEYYSVTKRNDLLIHAATWMDLENTMVSKRNQTQKPYIVRFHLYKMSSIGKAIETASRLLVAKVRGGEGMVSDH